MKKFLLYFFGAAILFVAAQLYYEKNTLYTTVKSSDELLTDDAWFLSRIHQKGQIKNFTKRDKALAIQFYASGDVIVVGKDVPDQTLRWYWKDDKTMILSEPLPYFTGTTYFADVSYNELRLLCQEDMLKGDDPSLIFKHEKDIEE